MLDELVDGAGFAEAHLALLRVHVDVDVPRLEREPQRVRRLAVVMQHVAVRFAQRVRQHAIADEAAVDEHVLAGHLRRVGGLHGEARDRERRRLRVDRRGGVDERVAQQRGDARPAAVRQQPVDQAPVVLKA